MKTFIMLIAILIGFTSWAGPKVEKKKLSALGAKLSTDHTFSGLDIKGKYQSSPEGLTTVENEKPIFDILDFPTNYDDRIRASTDWVR